MLLVVSVMMAVTGDNVVLMEIMTIMLGLVRIIAAS